MAWWMALIQVAGSVSNKKKQEGLIKEAQDQNSFNAFLNTLSPPNQKNEDTGLAFVGIIIFLIVISAFGIILLNRKNE